METPDLDAAFGTSKPFEYWLNDPTNPIVYCLLQLDGKDFLAKNGYTVELIQKTADHDTFCITVSDDALDSFQGYLMEHSKKLLGKSLSITFHHRGKPRHTFEGIIGGVTNKKDNGSGYGKLHITGYSPSILLESGKHCQSFENKTLEQIISEITAEYPREAKIKTDIPNTRHSLPYTVQYKESDYQFIRRLAIRHGEFFYYTGRQLTFGTGVQPIIRLGQGIDLKDIDFEMKIGAQDFKYIGYDAQSGSKIEKDSSSIQSEFKESLFQSIAVNDSKKIFSKKPNMHFNHTGIGPISEKELEEAVRLEKERREHLVQVRGKSDNPELKIGGRAELTDINVKPMETFRIIEIRHYHSGIQYYNEFVGIPDYFNAAHYIDTEAVPKGEEQPARVTDNNDPMGMGRVRVQFPWQEEKNQMTPWIRLIQPHSGAGKGFHFIPEIGEEVLVGFEGQNAEKPFVMGTHYNGSEKSSYHTAGNDLKVIKTRSGIEQIFNDAEGSWKQSTPDGNFLHFDGQGNATLNVPNDLTLNVGGNFNINVGKNVSFLVGLRAIYNIGLQMMMNTPILKYFVSDNYHLQSPKTLINGEGEIKIEAKETQVAGFEKLFVHSNESAVINSKGVVEIKGQDGTSNTNVAETIEKVLPLVDTKCIVHFRPKSEWQGEYGFCYFREKNNEISDSEEYKELLGKYYQFTERELTRINDDKFNELLEKYYFNQSGERLRFPQNRATENSFVRLFISDGNTWYKKRQKVKRITDTAGIITEKFESAVDETINNFKNDPQYKETNNSLQNLKDMYSNFRYNKIKKKGDKTITETYDYHGSFISLFPKTINYGKNEAEVDLKISFLEDKKPDYLIFKVDEQILKAENTFIGIDRLKIENPKEKETIKISCKTAENFTADKIIKVYAVKKQEEGKDDIETLAGCITMTVPVVRNLNVAIVGVKSKVGESNPGIPTQNWLSFFKKALGQALIKVNIIENHENRKIIVDISTTPNLSTNYSIATDGTIGNSDGVGNSTPSLKNLLNTKFETDFATIPDSYFRLFFLDVACGESGEEGGKTLGFSNYGWTCGLMFAGHNTATIAHECLHAMGLPHSFFHRNSSYVFKAMETHNIMDYSHLTVNPVNGSSRSSKTRYYTWKWQWDIARGYTLLS